jgi:DNA-binding GntR family transcriptional regulator
VDVQRPLVVVDRNSPVPLYFQVAQQLEAAIYGGELPAGSRLENEILLADRYGLSRPTMRQAIQHLVDKGLLVRKRGVGTQVVSGQQVRRSVELTSLYDDLTTTGRKPTTWVLECGFVPADEEVAEQLGLKPGDEVLRLLRVRMTDAEPLALMTNYLPASLIDLTAEQLTEHGLYELLRAAGVNLRIANQTIGARSATLEEARLLGETSEVPLLTMARTVYDDKGRAIEYGTHIYLASRYSFTLTLVER